MKTGRLHKPGNVKYKAKEIRQKVYEKLNGKCAYCGSDIEIKDMQIDHIIPQYNFYTHIKNNWKIPVFLNHLTEIDVNHFDNLFPTCRVCNKWKSAFDLELFRSEISEQIKRLNDHHSNYRLAKKYNLLKETIVPVKFYFETLI